jgi:hypothetical protein
MDSKDLLIFVTGIVGRAMGSGKFTPGDISFLVKEARTAFEEEFGVIGFAGASVPEHQPVVQAQVGSSQHISVAADKIVAAAAGGSVPAGFDSWKDLKCYYGKAEWILEGKPWPQSTWAEVLRAAQKGNSSAFKALEHMSKKPDPDSKWYAKDKEKSERAFQLLSMLKR